MANRTYSAESPAGRPHHGLASLGPRSRASLESRRSERLRGRLDASRTGGSFSEKFQTLEEEAMRRATMLLPTIPQAPPPLFDEAVEDEPDSGNAGNDTARRDATELTAASKPVMSERVRLPECCLYWTFSRNLSMTEAEALVTLPYFLLDDGLE